MPHAISDPCSRNVSEFCRPGPLPHPLGLELSRAWSLFQNEWISALFSVPGLPKQNKGSECRKHSQMGLNPDSANH